MRKFVPAWRGLLIGWAVAVFLGVQFGRVTTATSDIVTPARPPSCDTSKITICTMEVWLEHARKKQDKEIRDELKARSVKVLPQTVQYWRPTGGHPPANVAIGSGISAEDARWVLDLAFKYNDRIEYLILQFLNAPNYVAVATSAWDEKSQIPVSAEDVQRLRDPKLSTAEFHELYIQLTGEATNSKKIY